MQQRLRELSQGIAESGARTRPPSSIAADAALVLLILLGTSVYLSLLPRNLGFSDESYFLYEAKRIRDGDVMYRDLFEFVTPLAPYTMAGLYWLFGTSMATARITMAVVHALTAVAWYASCRRLGVRRSVSVLAPVAYVALCQSAWPYASWHWFSTFFSALLLLSLLASRRTERPVWIIAPGLIAGMLLCTQQQKGVMMAAGTVLALMIDAALDRRYGERFEPAALGVRLAYFGVGVVAVVLPVLTTFAVLAGWTSLYEALVQFPLENYRASFRAEWGALVGPTPLSTYPAVLKYSPIALAVPIATCLANLLRHRDREQTRRLTTLVVLSVAAPLSIAYFPDAIHIAFVAGFFGVAAAYSLEWALGCVRISAISKPATAVVVGALAAALGWQLVDHAVRMHRAFPVSHGTAFGQVDFATTAEPAFFDHLDGLLDAAPERELFCYPELVSPYLLTGATNPTPYQYLLARVSPSEQVTQTLRILEARRVPYVVGWVFALPPNDPIARYLRERYEPIAPSNGGSADTIYRLYRRRDSTRPDGSITMRSQ